MGFMLTPAKRAARQNALVVICGVLDEASSAAQHASNFLAEAVMPLRDDDAKAAKASLSKLISLIAFARDNAVIKRKYSASAADGSPAKLAKCRAIAGYPTGEEIAEYTRPS